MEKNQKARSHRKTIEVRFPREEGNEEPLYLKQNDCAHLQHWGEFFFHLCGRFCLYGV